MMHGFTLIVFCATHTISGTSLGLFCGLNFFWSSPLTPVPGLSVLEFIPYSRNSSMLTVHGRSTVHSGGVTTPTANSSLSMRLFFCKTSFSPMSAVVSANLSSISTQQIQLWYRKHGTLRGASQPRSINIPCPVHSCTL